MEEEIFAEIIFEAFRKYKYKHGKDIYPTWNNLCDELKEYFVRKSKQILIIK